MEEQLVDQINNDLSKNPTCECYHLRKYFGDKPLEEYSILRMMETFQDGFIAPGIKDSELVDLLIWRTVRNFENNPKLRDCLNYLFKYFTEIEKNG